MWNDQTDMGVLAKLNVVKPHYREVTQTLSALMLIPSALQSEISFYPIQKRHAAPWPHAGDAPFLGAQPLLLQV